MKLTEQIKNQIDENHQQFQPIIDELAKDEPECSYNYWDGWHKSVYWKSDKATVELIFYRNSRELKAYKDDDSEWMEIDTGRKSCIERNGVRTYFKWGTIETKYIKEAFSWL